MMICSIISTHSQRGRGLVPPSHMSPQTSSIVPIKSLMHLRLSLQPLRTLCANRSWDFLHPQQPGGGHLHSHCSQIQCVLSSRGFGQDNNMKLSSIWVTDLKVHFGT